MPTDKKFDEAAFQKWYKNHAKSLQLGPNPDDPRHKYDYRGAYKAGQGPGKSGHWPSEHKSDDHPSRYIKDGDGYLDTKTGRKLSKEKMEEIKKGIRESVSEEVWKDLE